MYKKLIFRALSVVIMMVTLLGALPTTFGSVTPEESVGDCTLYANNPAKFGSSVQGLGGVSCLFNHPVIQVFVTVYDVSAGVRSMQGYKSCPGASSCAVYSGTVPFVSGHTYRTEASVYFSGSNQYTQSSDTTIW